MFQNTALLAMTNDTTEEVLPKIYSFLISFNDAGKTTELLVNGNPACFKTTNGEPVDLADFIDVSLNIPEDHLNNFPEQFDDESIKILNQLNWCIRGGQWVTCKGPCK
jgi:hypothetical protein